MKYKVQSVIEEYKNRILKMFSMYVHIHLYKV